MANIHADNVNGCVLPLFQIFETEEDEGQNR